MDRRSKGRRLEDLEVKVAKIHMGVGYLHLDEHKRDHLLKLFEYRIKRLKRDLNK